MANSPDTPANEPEALEVFAFPTTLGQKRFWSLDSLQPGNPALNMPLAARLQGRINREAAQFAVDEVLRRHEILRTYFQQENDELLQMVGPFKRIQIRWSDLHDVAPNQIEEKTRELMLQEGSLSFDLSKGPLLRASIVSFSVSEHLLLLTMHHIGSDGWSNGVLIREFAEHYSRFISGGTAPEDLPLQYADFAVWQRDWLAGPGGQAQRAYWQAQLGNSVPALNLPTDRPRGPQPTFTGNIHSLLLPGDLTDAIRAAAQREGATPFMFVLAGYIMLLHRYSNRCDFVVGSPAACRNQTELEDMVGLFANPVLFHPRVDPSMTFRDLLLHVRDITLASFANQEYPFELIGEDLRTEDERRGVPWLQAYFVFQKAFMQPQHMPELELQPLRSISSGAMFEWMLGVIERKEGMRLQLEYCTDLFDFETIDRAVHHLRTILQHGAQNLDFRISQLVLDAPKNEPAPEAILPDGSLLKLISAAFDHRGDAVLVEHAGRQLSLEQIKTATAQFASSLGRKGSHSSRVELPLDNPLEAISAAIAVLETGHVAVCQPPVQRDQSAAASRVDLQWSRKSDQLELVNLRPSARATLNPTGWDVTDFKSSEAALVTPVAENFEDGHEHAIAGHHLIAHALAVGKTLGLQAGDRVYSAGSLHSVLGWEEIFSALLAGGTVVRGENKRRALRTRDTQSANVWLVATAAFQEWLRTASADDRTHLKTVRLIALDRDPLSPAALAVLRSVQARSIFLRHQLSGVGATVAVKEVPADTDAARRTLATIGQAVGHCILDVVDARGVPSPYGVPGRLRLRAPWLDRQALAAATGANEIPEFISDDWARYLSNGRLHWLGQTGDLARTSGYTLELAQLRQMACSHPDVWDAAVVTRANTSGFSVLLHVVPIPRHQVNTGAIAHHIRQRVPAYMVPSVILHEHTPLDRNGRWDYQALRDDQPTHAALSTPTGVTAPQPSITSNDSAKTMTLAEEKLAKIFASVLRRPSVDVEQSFFDLGGHSLLAVRLFASIEKEFGKRLPLATLLARPSVRLLAPKLEKDAAESSRWSCLVPMATVGDGPKFFCVHGAGGNVLLYRDLAKYMSPHARFYGLQAQGLDGESECLTKIEAMAALYLKEIQQEQPVGPYYIGGYCLGGNVAFEIARLLVERGHEVGLVAMLDTNNLTKSSYRRTFLGRLDNWRQKAGFHLDTVRKLSSADRNAYLSEKVRMARELARGKTAAIMRALKGNPSKAKKGSVSFVQDANHVALRAHLPTFNPAPLTLFQPRVNYSFFPMPDQGWKDLVGGRFEMVKLSANPHAMLIQPFVQELAAAVVARMQPPSANHNSAQSVEMEKAVS